MLRRIIVNQSSYLFLASILGIGMGLIASILNTHFLSPDEYGNYRYVFNIITFISSLLLFGYFVSGSRLLALSDSLIIRRRINAAMIVILVISVAITSLLMVPLYFIHKFWVNPSVANLFIYSIPVVGAPLFLNYINTTFQGENRIKGLAVARLIPYSIYIPFGFIIYYFWGASAERMMLLQNGCALLIYIVLIIGLKPEFKCLNSIFDRLRKENKSYGRYVYLGSVLAVSLGYVSAITLGIFQDNNAEVGFYTLALTMATPLTMLPSIVGTTHFKKFAIQTHIDIKVIRSTIFISMLSLISFIIMIVPVVKWVYSESYAVVGYYSIFLALAMTLHGFGDMFNRFLGAHGRGKEIRNSAIVTGLIQFIGSIIFVYFWGIWGALITKFFSSLMYFVLMNIYYHKTKGNLILSSV